MSDVSDVSRTLRKTEKTVHSEAILCGHWIVRDGIIRPFTQPEVGGDGAGVRTDVEEDDGEGHRKSYVTRVRQKHGALNLKQTLELIKTTTTC